MLTTYFTLYVGVLNVQIYKHALIKSQIIEFLSNVESNAKHIWVIW